MKKKTKAVAVDFSMRYLEIDGIKYLPVRTTIKDIDGVKHPDKMIFKEVSDKKLKDLEEKRAFITKKFAEVIPKERVLQEITDKFDTKDINGIYNLLKKKGAKVTPQDGCIGVLVKTPKKNRYFQLLN
jgi:hypothetical protein